jgi:hypothetical protein
MTESFPNPMTSTLFLSVFYFKSSDCPICPVCEQKRFSCPACNVRRRALKNAGISTVAQLTEWMGPGSLPELRAELSAVGKSFKREK